MKKMSWLTSRMASRPPPRGPPENSIQLRQLELPLNFAAPPFDLTFFTHPQTKVGLRMGSLIHEPIRKEWKAKLAPVYWWSLLGMGFGPPFGSLANGIGKMS